MDKNRVKKGPEENKKDLLNSGKRLPSKEVGANLPFSSDKDEAYEELHDPDRLGENI